MEKRSSRICKGMAHFAMTRGVNSLESGGKRVGNEMRKGGYMSESLCVAMH